MSKSDPKRLRLSASHWGAFRAEVVDGALRRIEPFEHDPEPSGLIHAWPEMLTSPLRVAAPLVRAGWLKGDGGAGRGEDEFVQVGWDEALDRAAGELARVRRDHGDAAIFGGSYGWSSAGRIHHARTLIRRFLYAFGGSTDQVMNYSYGAAQAFIPRMLGTKAAIGSHLTSAESIAAHCDIFLAFGGLPDRTWAVQSGGASTHVHGRFLAQLSRLRLVNISPSKADLDGAEAEWLPIRPNTDTALILALTREVIRAGKHDRAFLDRYTAGFEPFAAYLAGDSDGIEKTADWAAEICGIPAETIRALALSLPGKRVMLAANWALQRARHGEQPFWALAALAAVLGQIGLPGGGFGFGYGSTNGQGNPRFGTPLHGLPMGPNPAKSVIPVARVADMLLDPGGQYRFMGETGTYPDIRLVYWAGGNPFHHHQDLNRLREAFRRPETVIVHECHWTATARHADIVLPATTSLERNDLGGSSREPYLLAMEQLVPPQGEARNDFDIFADLAERLGDRDAFTGGRDEMGWIRQSYGRAVQEMAARGVTLPDFERFWAQGYAEIPAPPETYVMFGDYRADPERHRLNTPSGRIELFQKDLVAETEGRQPGHPAWLDPEEWLGAPLAKRYPLHLLTPQPARKLHGQMEGSAYVAEGKRDGLEPVRISEKAARERGIAEGDILRIFNDRGACHAWAQIDPALHDDVAMLATGSAYDPDGREDRGSNPNVLTRDIGSSEMGQGCAAQSCLVELARLDAPPRPIRSHKPPRIVQRQENGQE
ncbi:molybdopterin-dependent oxidoreductase [Salipiger abyssi]|uniref:Biotin/methionine sulfoxide reductase n=1 Tax=Salipiger abyssi TaxID=1250539 RepID=A0A1P8UMF6_9RHOB|nr:molybdopterin-dependent oxidoreductase [Salipiger abyssi]APZ50592.1 biotin/methionine sulfoxide reductase [Salipiger abyssi]